MRRDKGFLQANVRRLAKTFRLCSARRDRNSRKILVIPPRRVFRPQESYWEGARARAATRDGLRHRRLCHRARRTRAWFSSTARRRRSKLDSWVQHFPKPSARAVSGLYSTGGLLLRWAFRCRRLATTCGDDQDADDDDSYGNG
jgi:hypothetical protein